MLSLEEEKILYEKMSISEFQKYQKKPPKQAKFKMKSEFWPKMMYPEFLYNPDTYLKNHPNNLIFRSKYKLNYKKKDTSFISRLIENEKI